MKTSAQSHSSFQILRQAIRRHLAVEIELETPEGDRVLARSILLGGDDQFVYLERPILDGMPLELASFMSAAVYIINQGERFVFSSWVGDECSVPLGDQSVAGFSMPLPDQVFRHERRNDCRASLARCGEIIGTMIREEPCSSNPQVRLMNLSAGGAAVLMMDSKDHLLKFGGIYQLEFDLPGVKRLFRFRAELCHARQIAGAGFLLGLKFLPEENAAEMRSAIRQISQFVAKELKKKMKVST